VSGVKAKAGAGGEKSVSVASFGSARDDGPPQEAPRNEDTPLDDDVDSQASAMKAALVAARAQMERGDDDSAVVPSSKAQAETSRAASDPKTQVDTSGFGDDLVAKSETEDEAQTSKGDSLPPDLPPEVVAKLKTLRRLNPNRSYEELLAQATVDKGPQNAGTQKKKKWFGRK
jgi:hypothetical protein